MHGSLRRDGVVLDVQPNPHPYRDIEVRIGDRLVQAGRLERKGFFLADIRAAREVLLSLIAEGLFRTDEETEFDWAEHFDSVDAWKACLARPRVGELAADDRLIGSACSLMSRGEGEIVVTEQQRASRLVRLTAAK